MGCKALAILLVAIAIGSVFIPGNQPATSLILGIFGTGLFFFGCK